MILTGRQKSALKKAIVQAYREEELDVLLLERMELNYQAIARGEDCVTRVFNLIQHFENNGLLAEFIKVIVEGKPNSPFLIEIIIQLPSTEVHEPNKSTPSHKNMQTLNFTDGQELSITATFLEIPEITNQAPADSFLAIALLHQIVKSNYKNKEVAAIRNSLTGAIVIIPDSANLNIHETLQELTTMIAEKGIPLRIGIAHGIIKVFEDADGLTSFIGQPMNIAARLAKSKENSGIIYHKSYHNKVAGSIKSPDPLNPRYGSRIEVAGKIHDQPFIGFQVNPSEVRQPLDSDLLHQYDQSYVGTRKTVSSVIIAYDLPSFSAGDMTELSKRFRSVRDVMRDVKQNEAFPATFYFSPGGDGGILVLQGEVQKTPRIYVETAFRLIKALEIESDYKGASHFCNK
jgi:hypothetical protein